MIFDVLFLPFVFFLGIITAYEDIRYGKVRNRWILTGLVWGLSVILLFLTWYVFAPWLSRFFYLNILKRAPESVIPVSTVSPAYLAKVLINAGCALIVGFLMWRAGAWAAGDAKLFAVYALLIPLKYYWKTSLPYFQSFVLLINIFIPLLLYIFVRAFFYQAKWLYRRLSISKKTIHKEKKRTGVAFLKNIFNLNLIKGRVLRLTILLAVFFFFGSLAERIRAYLGLDISWLPSFLLATWIIFARSVSGFLQKPVVSGMIFLVFVLLLVYGFNVSFQETWQLLWRSLKMTIIFMAIMVSISRLIDFYIGKTSIEEIPIEELAPRMNLSDKFLAMLRKEDQVYYQKYIGVIYPGGLTSVQAEAIQKWAAAKKREKLKTVETYKTFPFVFWMFLGAMLTLILKGSVLHLIFGA